MWFICRKRPSITRDPHAKSEKMHVFCLKYPFLRTQYGYHTSMAELENSGLRTLESDLERIGAAPSTIGKFVAPSKSRVHARKKHLLEQEGIRFSLSGSLGNLSLGNHIGESSAHWRQGFDSGRRSLHLLHCCLGHAQGSWLWRTTQPISGAKCYSVLSKPDTALEAQRTCAGVVPRYIAS